MVSERTAAWAVTATTADLLWHFHNYRLRIDAGRRAIRELSFEGADLDIHARAIQSEVESARVIVAELRRRGHSVAWEE